MPNINLAYSTNVKNPTLVCKVFVKSNIPVSRIL